MVNQFMLGTVGDRNDLNENFDFTFFVKKILEILFKTA